MRRFAFVVALTFSCVIAEDKPNKPPEFTDKESAAVQRFLRTLAGRKVEQTFVNETRRSKFREDCILECLSRHVSSRMRFWAYFYHLMHEEVTEKDAFQRGMRLLKTYT